MKAIIPCSGFGSRMNMKPNQSKELLLDSKGKYIIEYSMDLCEDYGIEPLFITRPEKEDLIHYLKANDLNVLVQPPGKEWAETVHNSKDHWDSKNILILPDTRFTPTNAIQQVIDALNFGSEVVFGLHRVSDVSQWGNVTISQYCEKPKETTEGYAWGIIGFTDYAGDSLFRKMQTNDYNYHSFNTNYVFLNTFKDLTRTGVIDD
jgi:dTDP-glucose pyrophosphorylase